MTGQQLKNSILQMAVQGKLVPQDPNDEPASILLERIRAEKEALIKAGKIKKEKNPSVIFRGADNLPYEKVGKNDPVCIADEVPFDIPNSWEWVRLGSIGETNIGLTYKPSDKVDEGKGIAVLRSNNIQKGKMDYSDLIYVSCNVPERAMINKGDILICARNGSRALVGKSAIVDINGMAFGAFMAKYTSMLSGMLNKYVLTFIESPVFRRQLDGVKTETINQITQDMLKEQLIPMPPLGEQQRIIRKLEEIMPHIEKYEVAYSETAILNNEFPELLKKSILQEAVQGKLVPQNENDEPASVLLERIREEKARLVKEGKIKKDKNESVIFRRDNSHYEKLNGIEHCIDDEIPFDIPENWSWCRLNSIVYNHGQTTPTEDFCYIDIGSIDNKHQKLNKDENVVEASKAPSRARKIVELGDILYATVRPYLHNMCIVDKEFSCKPIASTGFAIMCCMNGINNKYLFYHLLSPVFDRYANDNENAKGVAYPAINDDKLYKALIPIPPFNEQNRIVETIENLIPHCEKL